MSNDSTAHGYLTPVGDSPQYDEALEREISRWIRGVSGLPAALVFPRWTDPQPQIPNNGVTWCGFGVTSIPLPVNPASVQIDENTSEQWEWERVTVICCFYGPQGASRASTFRAGLFIEQNNAELNRAGLSLSEIGNIYNLPELINNQWVRRYDITITLNRKTIRTYNIKSIVDGNVAISTGD
ncbi:hypothetical protein DEI78_13110 [Salmonella enterica subsp. enterica serovar Oranienburg]|nr:hypothetical protein [Salmonella enterica]EBG5024782.1 hypothetical protein [Salmonella enterica subsp. enterica serovar Oranienburg]EBU6209916.1 hypothetical protein [Salmonella enterica subsp. enterica]ECN6740026.1 hypothetical protein [Salmonella enterica subsp. enterica serovar Tennessee]EGA8865367.1 hypothetical protein [Salmonella enterica subsp. enterica serovar Pomona]HEC6530920.1 hypothetical protein [Salmonella enterica subsp. enterica serovar Virchow]